MKRIIAFVLALLMVMSLGVTAFAEDCAVTFKRWNGQIENTTYVVKGTLVDRPKTDPEREGYEFVEWRLDSEDGTPWNFEDPVNADITLVPKWKICIYTVTFDNQGHGTAPEAKTVDYNTTVETPGTLTETGYTFGGWFKESGCTTEWNFAADTVTGNTTIYAKWTVNKYKVTFDNNGHGSTAPEEQTIDYNKKATKPANPTDSDWSFVNWYTEATCDNEFNFETPITKDTNLFAKWLEMYTVTFDSKGGSDVPSKKVEKGSTVAEPSVPTKEHYEFVKWCSDSECTAEWNFDTAVTAATTLYALWKAEEYDVDFNVQGVGTAPENKKIEYNNTVAQPEDPSQEGYIFDGWYQEATCETEFNFSAPITADTTVYAKWIKLIDKPTASLKTYTYTGSEQTLVLDNPDDSGDYTVSGNKGTDVGDYTAIYTLVDKDNTAWNETDYPTADVAIDWSIEKVTVIPGLNPITCTFGDSEDDILSAAKNQFYEGNNVAIDPDDISFKYKNEPAGESEEFKTGVPTAVGTYKLVVVVKDSKNYNGYNSDIIGNTLTINPKEIDIIWTNTAFVYNGKDQTDDIEAKFEDVNGEDIFLDVVVTGGEFKNAGTYTVTAKIKDGYENYKLPSSAATSYTIAPKNIAGAEIELGKALIYNGKNQIQTVKKVKAGDLELTSADYDIFGNIKKDVDTYTLTIRGKGNFTGKATKQFVIIPGKNYDFKEDRHGNIKIGDGKIGFKDYNEKHTPEIRIAGDKGDLVEMLIKMGKITSDDLVRIANGETLNIMIETQKAYVSDRVWDKIEKRAGRKEIDSYFDIEFYLYWNDDIDDKDYITDTSGYGYVTVEVEAPDVKNAKSRDYSIIRYHHDGYKGHAVELSAKYSSKYDTLTFRTNQFSVYAIAYSKVIDKDDSTIVINGKGDKKDDKKKEDKKDINPNTGALVF